MEIKDNINIHFPAPQVLGWAACKCPLHCPGPSWPLLPEHPPPFLSAWVLGTQSTRSILLDMGQAGYISTTNWSLLHSTLDTTVHFNRLNGIAYTRPLSVSYSSLFIRKYSILTLDCILGISIPFYKNHHHLCKSINIIHQTAPSLS